MPARLPPACAPRGLLGLAALATLLGACLDVPSGPSPECESSEDCRASAGEICDEGTCWGDPPAAQYAAVVSPPSGRPDLVAKEMTSLSISPDGWIDGLALDAPVTWTGRIEELCEAPMVCSRVSLGALITVTRPSPFQGGPGFKAVVTAIAGGDGPSFSFTLPRSREGDAPYSVTVVPGGRGLEPDDLATTAAQLVPPMRMELWADGDISRTITLGGLDLPQITGVIQTASAVGLSHHRVVALGHWDEAAPPTEVSTVDYTGADGMFRLTLSPGLVGPVEIVARPYGDVVAPTLRLGNVPAATSSTRVLQQPADLGTATTAKLAIVAQTTGGEITGVGGATVRATATVTPPGSATRATVVVEATTDDAGVVELPLLEGAAFADSYRLEVVPPASARVGAIYDAPLEVDTSYAPKLLPARVPIRGLVTDAEGHPLEGVAVTARPSLRFAWSLEDLPQAFLAGIPAATALTPATGEFVLFVDRTIGDVWGHYDLVFEPSATTRAPAFVLPEVEIPRDDRDEIELEATVRLPDAAFVRGQVTDPAGEQVEAAELKVFRISTSLTLCGQVKNAPTSCPIPAQLQGRGGSDGDGVVRIALPR